MAQSDTTFATWYAIHTKYITRLRTENTWQYSVSFLPKNGHMILECGLNLMRHISCNESQT